MTMLSPYDPEIETLWRAIIAAGARSVAVVSAGAGEGTTMIAAALARRAGIAGIGGLLVDLNRTRPAVARLMGLRPQPGEMVALHGITVLAQPHEDDLDMWRDSAVLAHRAETWAGQYGVVVFDTAPVLSADAALRGASVAGAADLTIIVAQTGHTTPQALLDTRSRLIVAGARVLATVTSERDKVSLMAKLENPPSRLAPALARAKGVAQGSASLARATGGTLARAGGLMASLTRGRLGGLLPSAARAAG
jgi:Mrp family chromosome partitioning ATPase